MKSSNELPCCGNKLFDVLESNGYEYSVYGDYTWYKFGPDCSKGKRIEDFGLSFSSYKVSSNYYNLTFKEFLSLYNSNQINNKIPFEIARLPSRLNNDQRIFIKYDDQIILLNNPDGFDFDLSNFEVELKS